jgi:SAM-dependent methyltransferase
MDESAEVRQPLFGTHSNYVFAANVDDRQRLAYQFSLLREDFNLWFDETLRLGGLSTDPAEAAWSALDMGCGEGQYTREIAQRYPGAAVVGTDVDAGAIAGAVRAGASVRNARFLVHDAREPVPATARGGAGFDVVVVWMVLLYLPDKRKALSDLAAALRPGGVILLGNVPDVSIQLAHPAVAEIMTAGYAMMRRLGLLGLEDGLDRLMHEAGFTDVTTATLRYPVGGGTGSGRRWATHTLNSFAAGRHLVVDIAGAMDGAEYDRRLARLAGEPVIHLQGECRFLATVGRLAAPRAGGDPR